MPRQRTGKKPTPDYPSQHVPDIAVLLRDAQPTRAEILGDPDTRRRRDTAVDHLIKMYNEAQRTGEELDFAYACFAKS